MRAIVAAVDRALCAALGRRAAALFGDEIGLHAVQVASLAARRRPAAVAAARAVVDALAANRCRGRAVAPSG